LCLYLQGNDVSERRRDKVSRWTQSHIGLFYIFKARKTNQLTIEFDDLKVKNMH